MLFQVSESAASRQLLAAPQTLLLVKSLDTELNDILQSEEGSADELLFWVALVTLFVQEEDIWLVTAVLMSTEPTQALDLKSHFCQSSTKQTQKGMLASPSGLKED